MTRHTVETPASSRPNLIAVPALADSWTTVAEAPDYSVADTQELYAVRDPSDAARRIQPGIVIFSAPLMLYNADSVARWVEIRLLRENGDTVMQGRVTVPSLWTHVHPIPGQVLLKNSAGATNGDRLQLRAQVAGVIAVTGSAEIGGAEEDVPEATS